MTAVADLPRPWAELQASIAATVTRAHDEVPAGFAAVRVHVDEALAYGRAATRRLRMLVGLTELVVKAVGDSRGAHPWCFAGSANVAVAIDVGAGLFLPVVRDVDQTELREIGEALLRHRHTAMRGRFRSEDLTGGAIVLALANDDALLSRPIIYPGTVCAVSVAATARVPFRDPATATLSAISVAHVGLSFDQRLLTVRDALAFLLTLKAKLESPGSLDARVD